MCTDVIVDLRIHDDKISGIFNPLRVTDPQSITLWIRETIGTVVQSYTEQIPVIVKFPPAISNLHVTFQEL